MSLAAGSKLGPYEILAAIGAGGMGEVYRARDPRLNRDVAIKVSAAHFSERFEREARAIAALNHPHICQIYDVGPNYLVMELVEGQNLKGPLPLDTAVKYAGQIAEALEAAHEKGIVHRDLKPGNIKINPAGAVKILDFGLAKVAPASPSEPPAENSPTMTMGMTQAGVILGTAAYMSPEQARGEPVDKRADIWAFGVVFYEMLAGQHMYQGKTVSDVLAAVLVKEPDLNKVPPQVRKLLRRCLEKDPKKRLRDIADAMPLVEEAPEPTAPSQTRLGKGGRAGMGGWIAASLLAVIAGMALWGWLKPASPAKPVTRFTVTLPAAAFTNIDMPVLSRDGSILAFPSGLGKPIYLRSMNSLEVRALPGTEGAAGVVFSPDGQWIAYRVSGNEGSIKKIPLAGGAPLTLAEGLAVSAPDLDWGLDDNIYFTTQNKLLRVSSNGGKTQTLLTADPKKGELQYSAPQLLPGGREVLLVRLTTKGVNLGQIVALNIETGETKTLLEGSLKARYAATGARSESGYIVYGLNGALLAVPFEVSGLKTGSPVPVLEDVAGIGPLAQFGLSDSGAPAYLAGAPTDSNVIGVATLLWVDRQGKELPIVAPPRLYANTPQLSPDSGRVALSALDLQRFIPDLWVSDLARSNQPRITFEGNNGDPVWTPDGKRLIYWFSRDLMGQQNPEIRSVPADSSGQPTTLLAADAPAYVPRSVSPDGKLLMGIRNKPGTVQNGGGAGDEIWILPLDPSLGISNAKLDARPRTFVEGQAPFIRDNPQFSPDGRWVAYQANDSSRDEVYVVPYPGPGGRQQASTDGGTEPRWSRSGRELFYRNGNKMMAVEVQTTPSFHVMGPPKVLFEKPALGYDVAADGKKFLLLRRGAPEAQSSQINVVLNWFEELRSRVPK